MKKEESAFKLSTILRGALVKNLEKVTSTVSYQKK